MKEKFYLMIAGSRSFVDYEVLKEKTDFVLKNIDPETCDVVIVSGGARGADAMAERYAADKGYEKKIFPAQWNKYGKRAGYLRNEEMQRFIASQKYKGIICFWDGTSPGTKHNFELSKKLKNPIRVYNYQTNHFIKV